MFTTPFATIVTPSDFEAFSAEFAEYCEMLDELAQAEQDAAAEIQAKSDEVCPDCEGESVGRYWCEVCHSTGK